MPPSNNNPLSGQLAGIERALGELTGGVSAILREIDSLKAERREDVLAASSRMDRLESDIQIVGATAAQARDVADKAKVKAESVETIVLREVKPETDKIKSISWKAFGFIAGISIASGAIASPVLSAIASTITNLTK